MSNFIVLIIRWFFDLKEFHPATGFFRQNMSESGHAFITSQKNQDCFGALGTGWDYSQNWGFEVQ